MVFTQNTNHHMRMINSTTGKDPVLTTVAGTYSYDITTTNGFSDNAWRVSNVYIDDISESEDVTLFDADSNNAAKVVFKEDPGSGTYYIRAYKFPPTIGSKSVNLSIPQAYHLTHVYEGICGFIEKFRSGKSERLDIFMGKLLPELVSKLSSNNTQFEYPITLRGF